MTRRTSPLGLAPSLCLLLALSCAASPAAQGGGQAAQPETGVASLGEAREAQLALPVVEVKAGDPASGPILTPSSLPLLSSAAETAPLPGSATVQDAADSLPELFDPRRTPLPLSVFILQLPEPLPPQAKASALPPPAPALASSQLSDKAAAEKVAADKAAADKAAAEKVAADKAVADKAAADKTAADKAASDKAAAAKIAADKAAAEKAAADKAAASAKVSAVPTTPPSTGLAAAASSLPPQAPDVSRKIAVEIGTRIELPFDGTGWTYLGERDGKSGILYETRRYEASGLVFVLNPAQKGDYLLRFQKQDLARGTTSEELVAVTVTPKPAVSVPAGAAGASSSGGVAVTGTGAASPSTAGSQATASTVSASTGNVSPPSSEASAQAATAATLAALPGTPEALLIFARNELGASRIAGCLAALDRFLSLWPAGMDEVFYLYGKALEQQGPLQDVKRAYQNYKRVRDEYPQSEFWDSAAERVSYIGRHYFDIR